MARTKGNRKRARAEAGDDFRDMYTGWRPPAGGGACLEAQSLEPEGFWRAHIAPRRPAVIRAPLPGLEAVRCWTDDALVGAAVRGIERPLAERPPGPAARCTPSSRSTASPASARLQRLSRMCT